MSEQVKMTGPELAGVNGEKKDPHYILATAPLADEQTRVLKQGDTFAVFDHNGDIKPTGLGEQGIYHEGTRFLSCLLLGLGDIRPLFLSSTVREDNDLLAVDLTNPDVSLDHHVVVPRGTLHIARVKFLWQGVYYERYSIKNHGIDPVDASLSLHFTADFADIFEVRGSRRPRRGQYLASVIEEGSLVLGYRGLDGVTRRCRLHFDPPPDLLLEREARLDVSLPPQAEATFVLTITCERDESRPALLLYDVARETVASALKKTKQHACTLCSTNNQFNAWMNRTVADLHMMITETDHGPYPYAGVPWFSTPFGRDGILTALECLWINPGLARGVLAYLADTQATAVIPEQDAEPGKILHETRRGEMAALGEIPFGRYYGSVDSTPLFVLLAGAYYERTADRAFIEALWPNLEAALRWIDRYGDADGDGFVEYLRHSPKGLVQQGWKDSHDSVFHADGSLADGPIALCEVQGYVYAAKCAAAELAFALGKTEAAEELARQAWLLQERFERTYWCEGLGTYALALDGEKRPCRVRTSNAGHCLFTGIVNPQRARITARTLLNADSFSGWGIRTVAASEPRYNPMSYHNGSIWPHDNALIAQGLARYNLKEGVLAITSSLFDASLFLDLHRLPELFCGFIRRTGEGPTLYPVACAPQAWSAAAVFQLVQACLGLTISAVESRICLSYPVLPAFLKDLQVHNLQVGDASVDLLLQRHGDDVGANVLRREGHVEILVVK